MVQLQPQGLGERVGRVLGRGVAAAALVDLDPGDRADDHDARVDARDRRAGSSALVTATTPITFDSNISRQRSSSASSSRLEPERAAGAVDDHVDPRQLVGERRDRVRVGDVERQRPPADLAPRAPRSARAAAPRRPSRSPSAASARTVASPIPLEAPVTSAIGLALDHSPRLTRGRRNRAAAGSGRKGQMSEQDAGEIGRGDPRAELPAREAREAAAALDRRAAAAAGCCPTT